MPQTVTTIHETPQLSIRAAVRPGSVDIEARRADSDRCVPLRDVRIRSLSRPIIEAADVKDRAPRVSTVIPMKMLPIAVAAMVIPRERQPPSFQD